MELRRAEGGIRAWAAEPGEYCTRPTAPMAGCGGATGVRRRCWPASASPARGCSRARITACCPPRATRGTPGSSRAWTGETFGDYGLSGGGAAGFELDRADPALGTPEGTAILARSEDPPASFVTVPEELLSHVTTITGEKADALKRAEIVYLRHAGRRRVFATGSITWCGSLWQDGAFQGDVSRIMENVLRRFAAP